MSLSFSGQVEEWMTQKDQMQAANDQAAAKRKSSNSGMLQREQKRLATTLLRF
jgi:hypothetical protein